GIPRSRSRRSRLRSTRRPWPAICATRGSRRPPRAERRSVYVPPSNAEHRPEVMLDYMEAHPLAALVTSSSDGLIATHLPLLVDRTRGSNGTLAGHLARANPQQRQARDGDDALVIFSAHDAYITPTFYASKTRDGK